MSDMKEFDGCACGAGSRHSTSTRLAEIVLTDGSVLIAANHTPEQLVQGASHGYEPHERILAVDPVDGEYIFVSHREIESFEPIGELELQLLGIFLPPGISP